MSCVLLKVVGENSEIWMAILAYADSRPAGGYG